MYTTTTNCIVSNTSKIVNIVKFMYKNKIAVYNNALWKYSAKPKV